MLVTKVEKLESVIDLSFFYFTGLLYKIIPKALRSIVLSRAAE